MKPSILQTELWENFQKSLHETTFFEKNKDFQYLAIKKSTPVGNYLYLPYGPHIAKKSASQTAYEAIERLARQENVIFIRIEPMDAEITSYWLTRKNCKKSKDLSPAHTWILDLTLEKDQILSQMKQNNRNIFRNYSKKGIQITTSHDPKDAKILVNLQKRVASRDHFIPPDLKIFKLQLSQPFSTLYLAKINQKTIASALCFDDDTTRYYMQAAADDNYRKFSAGTALLAQMIMDAKDKNLQKFDFWGIAPDNAPKNHPWLGFTKFKKSFGGQEVTYAGTYDLIFQPTTYKIYQILRAINRFTRKLTH